MEGVYIRPDYEPIAKGSQIDLAKDMLENGFCNADGKMLEHPEHIGIVQAKEIIESFYGACDDLGKRG